jgi:peptidyl-prolyl cis-trans isomerase A (cyclophilin A)
VNSTSTVNRAALLAACTAGLLACNAPPEPQPDPAVTQKPASTAAVQTAKPRPTMQPTPPKPRAVHAKPVAEVKASADDPLKGKWTLEDATKDLPKGDVLVASIETDMGTIECTLFGDKAPITVANFVGLANGKRAWKTPDGKWETKPAYDDTVFHRIIKGFMIQGGDAKKNGSGEAGYVIPDEVWEGGSHDRPGLLCMANRGPNTNSAQFFITDEAAYHLDNGYTIFGECGPVSLVHEIASVKMAGRDRPEKTPVIKKVRVTRKAAPAAASGSAAASAAPSGAPSAGPSAAPTAAATAAPTGAATAAPTTKGAATPTKSTQGSAVATSPGPTAPVPDR